jgi:hypothetical protein
MSKFRLERKDENNNNIEYSTDYETFVNEELSVTSDENGKYTFKSEIENKTFAYYQLKEDEEMTDIKMGKLTKFFHDKLLEGIFGEGEVVE